VFVPSNVLDRPFGTGLPVGFACELPSGFQRDGASETPIE
jgi:hypothetical protein